MQGTPALRWWGEGVDAGFGKGGGTTETLLCDRQFCCIINRSEAINMATADLKCGKTGLIYIILAMSICELVY